MIMTHAKYSPSKLSRILACPGSVKFSEQFPEEPESSYAAEGTMLHEVASQLLQGDNRRYAYLKLEQKHAVEKAAKTVRGIRAQIADNSSTMYDTSILYLDQRVKMLDVPVEGTLDVALTSFDELHVIDFKFGAGVPVHAENNPQLLAYLDGMIQHLCFAGLTPPPIMRMHIIQPRLDSHTISQVTQEQLQAFRVQVQHAINQAESLDPPLNAGEKQCRWCPCGGACSERMRLMQENAAKAYAIFADKEPWSKKSNEELAKILATKSQVDQAFTTIEVYLRAQLQQGQEVPGYKLVSGRSSNKWNEGVTAFELSDAFGINLEDLTEIKTISVAQMKKLLNKDGIEALKDFYVNMPGAPAMAPKSSVKQAIKPSLSEMADDPAELI